MKTLSFSRETSRKVMHSILHHFGDWELETRHMSRLERSIYFDMRTAYLTGGVGLTADLELLERRLMCNESNEKEALRFLLRDKFKLDKKSNQYKHIEWNQILRGYKEPLNGNDGVTECNTNSNDGVTEEVTERNAMSNAERQQKLRQQAREMKSYLDRLGIVFDRKMPFGKLRELFKTHAGELVERNDGITERNGSNEANNAEKVSITINQEPMEENQQQKAREENFSLPEANTAKSQQIDPLADVLPQRFAMAHDWQPHDVNMVNALLRRAGLPNCNTGLVLDAAVDFVSYWVAKPDRVATAQEWDSDFVRSVQKFRTKYGHNYDPKTWESKQMTTVTVQSTSAAQSANAPSKTKQSTMTLMAVREAVAAGKLQTVLSPKICLVLIDGLLDLLGQGLKYPPAADAWEFTLTAWANEFARYGLVDDDIQRVQKAFQIAKKQATQSHDRRFPEIVDVLSCLPMKLVQKIEHKLTPQEWKEKSTQGRKQTGELLKIIGKKQVQAA